MVKGSTSNLFQENKDPRDVKVQTNTCTDRNKLEIVLFDKKEKKCFLEIFRRLQ